MFKKYQQFGSAFALYVLSEIAARSIQFICLFWLGQTCTREAYGQVGLLIALQQFVAMIAQAGIVEAMTGKANDFRSAEQTAYLFTNLIRLFDRKCIVVLFATVILFLCSQSLPQFRIPLLGGLSAVVSGLLIARFRVVGSAHQIRERHLRAVQFFTLPLAVCFSAGLLLMLLAEDRVVAFFVGNALGLLAVTAVYAVTLSNKGATRVKADSNLQQTILRESFPFAAVALFGWLSGSGNSVLIGGILGRAEVADYAMACNFCFVLYLVLNAIAQVWQPYFVRISAESPKEHVNLLNALVFHVQTMSIGIVSGLIIILFPSILRLLGGHMLDYEHIQPYLFLLMVGYVVLSGYSRSQPYYIVYRTGRAYLFVSVASGVIGFALWFLCMILLGADGVYIGFIANMFVRAVSTHEYARVRWGVSSPWRDALEAVVIMALSMSLSMLLRDGTASVAISILLYGVGVAALCIAGYFVSFRSRNRSLILYITSAGAPPVKSCQAEESPPVIV